MVLGMLPSSLGLALALVLAAVVRHAQRLGRVLGSRRGLDSRLTQLIAPLLANNSKCFLLACLTSAAEHFRDNHATLRIATSAGLINTACLRSADAALPVFATLPPEPPRPRPEPPRATAEPPRAEPSEHLYNYAVPELQPKDIGVVLL